jgi:hypothetical protein
MGGPGKHSATQSRRCAPGVGVAGGILDVRGLRRSRGAPFQYSALRVRFSVMEDRITNMSARLEGEARPPATPSNAIDSHSHKWRNLRIE